MSAALEEKVIKKVVGLSDDNLMFLSDMIDRLMQPAQAENTSKRIGVAEGKFVVPDDFDDCDLFFFWNYFMIYSQLYSQYVIINIVGNKSWVKEHTNGGQTDRFRFMCFK